MAWQEVGNLLPNLRSATPSTKATSRHVSAKHASPTMRTVVIGVGSVRGDFGAVRQLYMVFIIHESGHRSTLIESDTKSFLGRPHQSLLS
jgi:hypothetical protein